MNFTAMLATVVVVGAVTCCVMPAQAANAKHPHTNVDKRVDKGGDTGDAQVEKLNQQQLDSIHAQNGSGMAQPGLGAPMMQQTVPGSPAH